MQQTPASPKNASNAGSYSIYRTCIEQVMQGSERLPSLPAITLEIRNAIADNNVTHKQLAELIANDPSLCILIMRYVSSPIYLTQEQPRTIEEAIRLLGIAGLDRVVMLHSLKSLFIFRNRSLKQLFDLTWKRLTLKACIAEHLAKKLNYKPADEVLISSLLSEAGTLAILSALTNIKDIPDEVTYLKLCRQYSKSLGLIILKKWNLGGQYSEVIEKSGVWTSGTSNSYTPLELTDIVNLALYHGVALFRPNNTLPDLDSLDMYKKLPAALKHCNEKGLLRLVTDHTTDIAKASKVLH